MDFPFDINQLFPERVSVLDQTLIAGRKAAGRPDLQAQIATVIDELGRASAKAQQLTAAITSASKMQSQRHQLYLLKDGESNGGRGVVVGFLKVGYKKLFLLDRHGVHVEAEPLCVLDFYIAENLQRHGYGQELFDFVLQHKNFEPVLMAYDRPSPKFLSFLAKHYCLTQIVPQVNNFVVFDGFFFNRSAAQLRKVPLRKPEGEIKPYSLMEREVVRQEQRSLPWPFAPPHSPQRSVSSQYSHSLSVGSSPTRAPVSTASAPGGTREPSLQSPLTERCRARRTSQPGLVARSCLYSRHMDSSTVEQLDTHLPGLRAVGDESCALGHTDTHITPQSRSLSAPPQPAPTDASEVSTDTPPEDELQGEEQQLQVSPGGSQVALSQPSDKACDGRKDSSWTVGENCFTAQWVKHKQEYKSTRPW